MQPQPALSAYPLDPSEPELGVTAHVLHYYVPADMTAAYGVDALHAEGFTGAGQTIVIVDPYGSPTAREDLQFFSSHFGLSAPDLTIIYPEGTPAYNTTALNGYESGAALETSLDLQWAHVIAPDAKLVLIVTNPGETEGVQGFPGILKGIQYALENYPGSPISQSFAAAEQSFDAADVVLLQNYEATYQQAIAAGCTPLAAAGDWGTANADKQGNIFPYQTVCWPASSPSVTAVGGTWLQYHWLWDPHTNFTAFLDYARTDAHPFRDKIPAALAFLNWEPTSDGVEAVWREDWLAFNRPFGLATGGGLSAIFPAPDWQAGLATSLTQGHRALPDVSWNAAVNGGVYVRCSVLEGSFTVGGTSASTPQIAGLVALVNQLRATLGKGPIGHLAPKLYQLPASDFNDIVPQTFGTAPNAITVEDNFRYGFDVPGYPTTPGYDLTTGLGSPKAYGFVHDLAAMFP